MATLPSNIEQRINNDADAYASNMRESRAYDIHAGYIVGATEYATRAQVLVDALEKLNKSVQHLFDVRKEKNKNNQVQNAWNDVAFKLRDANTALQSWNQKEGV